MRRLAITSLVALAVAALAAPAVTTPPGASAGRDSTPPRIVLGDYARPLVGSTIETNYADGHLEVWQATFSLRWHASDRSGICEQTLAWYSYENIGGAPDDPLLPGATAYTSLKPWARSFAPIGVFSLNHGRIPDRFYVKVTDCAGNTAYSGIADTEFGTREDDAPGISYFGKWRTRTSECCFDTGYSGGTVHRSATRHSSVAATFEGVGPVAVVMGTGPTHGKADIYVDGARKATVNTWSRHSRRRVVVWEGEYAGGTHRIKVVNRATPGHPVIEFDALVLCEQDPTVSGCIDD